MKSPLNPSNKCVCGQPLHYGKCLSNLEDKDLNKLLNDFALELLLLQDQPLNKNYDKEETDLKNLYIAQIQSQYLPKQKVLEALEPKGLPHIDEVKLRQEIKKELGLE